MPLGKRKAKSDESPTPKRRQETSTEPAHDELTLETSRNGNTGRDHRTGTHGHTNDPLSVPHGYDGYVNGEPSASLSNGQSANPPGLYGNSNNPPNNFQGYTNGGPNSSLSNGYNPGAPMMHGNPGHPLTALPSYTVRGPYPGLNNGPDAIAPVVNGSATHLAQQQDGSWPWPSDNYDKHQLRQYMITMYRHFERPRDIVSDPSIQTYLRLVEVYRIAQANNIPSSLLDLGEFEVWPETKEDRDNEPQVTKTEANQAAQAAASEDANVKKVKAKATGGETTNTYTTQAQGPELAVLMTEALNSPIQWRQANDAAGAWAQQRIQAVTTKRKAGKAKKKAAAAGEAEADVDAEVGTTNSPRSGSQAPSALRGAGSGQGRGRTQRYRAPDNEQPEKKPSRGDEPENASAANFAPNLGLMEGHSVEMGTSSNLWQLQQPAEEQALTEPQGRDSGDPSWPSNMDPTFFLIGGSDSNGLPQPSSAQQQAHGVPSASATQGSSAAIATMASGLDTQETADDDLVGRVNQSRSARELDEDLFGELTWIDRI